MKLFIPELETLLRLEKDWTFTLIAESRNESLFGELQEIDFWKPYIQQNIITTPENLEYLYYNNKNFRNIKTELKKENVKRFGRMVNSYKVTGERAYFKFKDPKKFTLPKGTLLKVDRIYIRRGQSKFSSLTFRIRECPVEKYVKARFFAKLSDVNKMYVRIEKK